MPRDPGPAAETLSRRDRPLGAPRPDDDRIARGRQPPGQSAALVAGAAEDPDHQGGDIGADFGWIRAAQPCPDPARAGSGRGTMEGMNAEQVAALRAAARPDRMAGADGGVRPRRCAAPRGPPAACWWSGTPTQEPWHLAAHLDEESRLAGIPELAPTLVRWAPPPDAPPHLRIGVERLETAGRGESLLVVSPQAAPDPLLERVHDARRMRRDHPGAGPR